jgi:hypothetical protein
MRTRLRAAAPNTTRVNGSALHRGNAHSLTLLLLQHHRRAHRQHLLSSVIFSSTVFAGAIDNFPHFCKLHPSSLGLASSTFALLGSATFSSTGFAGAINSFAQFRQLHPSSLSFANSTVAFLFSANYGFYFLSTDFSSTARCVRTSFVSANASSFPL